MGIQNDLALYYFALVFVISARYVCSILHCCTWPSELRFFTSVLLLLSKSNRATWRICSFFTSPISSFQFSYTLSPLAFTYSQDGCL